jgi:regulatory protein SWI6
MATRVDHDITQDNDATEIELNSSTHIRDSSLYATPQPSFSDPQNSLLGPSTIYTATYSGIKVLETVVKGVSIMRRRNDSSFNATQILKVAGVDKARRTKILEKEVHTGVHEKVQGGYGKFQGTWIPYDRAVALAQQYGVYDDLKPLFLFNVSTTDANETPTKEQAIAQKKKLGGNSFYSTISRQPSGLGRSYSTLTDNDETEIVENSTLMSPTKKFKLENGDAVGITERPERLPEIYEHDLELENPNAPFTLDPLSVYVAEGEHSKEIITQIFLSQDIESLADAVGGESALADVNLDVSIDEMGHTALHWASALARIPLVKELVRRGSIRIRGNNQGESPLIRAVLVTNNYDQGSFTELLDLLYPCIPLLDHQRRSVLHHIALTAGIKSRSAASRYYLETLLEWIVKTGSSLTKGAMTLGKFMNEIVNAQDKNGDTCLNIAARIGNKAIVQQLLDVGADPSIPNRAGLRPVDFGINVNGLANATAKSSHNSTSNTYNSIPQSGQSSQKILDSMQQVLLRLDYDFKAEISAKQKTIDELHVKLRSATTKLSESRKNLETLKESEIKLSELKQKISNIDRATVEEEQRFLEKTTELGSIGNYDVDFDADEPFRVIPIYDAIMKQIAQKKSLDEVSIDPRTININDLPPPEVLSARIKAYKENESDLRHIIEDLNQKSKNLENKFRRVVSLCTGVPEDEIDNILDGLVQAVESDPDEVDMGRVVGFLRKVDDKIDV